MRRLPLTLCFALLLSACGGDDGGSGGSCLLHSNGEVSVCTSAGWSLMDPETRRQRGIPQETVYVFQRDVPLSGFFPTIVVTREVLAQPATAEEYSQASMQSVQVYNDYELLDEKPVTIDGEDVSLHVFTARPKPTQPKERFAQISTVHNGIGYTISSITPLSIKEDVSIEVENILVSLDFEEE